MRGRVTPVTTCDLLVGSGDWPFARTHAAEIDAHWQQRSAENPAYFNGCIFMLADGRIDGGILAGRLVPVEFKAFLYWKERGAPETGLRDVFGSALIRSADGAVLLGRQRAGNLNAGLVYLPGGFIDPRDVEGGRVDIRASVLREVEEETGLSARDLGVSDGYLVTTTGSQVSIGVDVFVASTGDAAVRAITETLAGENDPELDAIVAVRTLADLAALAVPDYTRILLAHVLGSDGAAAGG